MSDRLEKKPLETPEPEHFRRRQFRAPHRRRGLVARLARPFLGALAIVVLPSALIGWVLFSDQFEIREVQVTGTARVPASWAGERLATLEGRPIFGVGLADVETALAGHHWVQGALLTRRPPDRLEIEILERIPAALVAFDETLSYLDAEGKIIGPWDPAIDSPDLVLLSAPENRVDFLESGLALLDAWRRKRLPYGDGLSEINILTQTDFRVITAALPFPILVSSLNLADGLASLVRFGPQLQPRLTGLPSIGAVDLRFHGRIVFQPAAPRSHNLEGERDA